MGPGDGIQMQRLLDLPSVLDAKTEFNPHLSAHSAAAINVSIFFVMPPGGKPPNDYAGHLDAHFIGLFD